MHIVYVLRLYYWDSKHINVFWTGPIHFHFKCITYHNFLSFLMQRGTTLCQKCCHLGVIWNIPLRNACIMYISTNNRPWARDDVWGESKHCSHQGISEMMLPGCINTLWNILACTFLFQVIVMELDISMKYTFVQCTSAFTRSVMMLKTESLYKCIKIIQLLSSNCFFTLHNMMRHFFTKFNLIHLYITKMVKPTV